MLVFSSADHEPLFYVQPDEEIDVSVDEICTDPGTRASAHSDASLASTGILSNISSHGSPEPQTFETSVSPSGNETDDQVENFHDRHFTAQNDVFNDTAGQLESNMALMSVEDEQEGRFFNPLNPRVISIKISVSCTT